MTSTDPAPTLSSPPIPTPESRLPIPPPDPRLPIPFALLASLLTACVADASLDDLPPEALAPDAAPGPAAQALATGTLRLNDVYYVPKRTGLADAPMYTTATGASVVRRIPEQAAVKIVIAAPSNDRYRVDHAGTLGWMRGRDLTLRHRYDARLSETRINALARARKAMGFSYWWSNARWLPTGATTWPVDNTGRCSGVCGGKTPCTHAATGGGEEYGSDCSGFVSTIWGFRDYDPLTNPKNNGFGTAAYAVDSADWRTIPFADARAGDAVVRHDDDKKHIFLVASAYDGKQRFDTYECAGCSEGCRTKRRTIPDDGLWHAIRRTGW